MKNVETEVLYVGKQPLLGHRTMMWKPYRWWNPSHWSREKRYKLLMKSGPSKTVTVGGDLDDAFEVILKKLEEDRWEVQS